MQLPGRFDDHAPQLPLREGIHDAESRKGRHDGSDVGLVERGRKGAKSCPLHLDLSGTMTGDRVDEEEALSQGEQIRHREEVALEGFEKNRPLARPSLTQLLYGDHTHPVVARESVADADDS